MVPNCVTHHNLVVAIPYNIHLTVYITQIFFQLLILKNDYTPTSLILKQPFTDFLQNRYCKKFRKFHWKSTCVGLSFLNKVADFQPTMLFKETPAHLLSCKFLWNLSKHLFNRTPPGVRFYKSLGHRNTGLATRIILYFSRV